MLPKRKYELKKRADEMAETHLRITEAAIELHGTVGPARTTMSAVAQRAGVERRTLYRHFPSEAELFAACSTHYFAANPFPDLANWRAIGDPQQRLERALGGLYAYLRAHGADARQRPARRRGHGLRARRRRPAERLSRGSRRDPDRRRAPRRRRHLVAGAVRHAVAFSTWRSLSFNAIERADAAQLMATFVGSIR